MISLAFKVAGFIGIPEKFRSIAAHLLLAVFAGLVVWAVFAWDAARLSAQFDKGVMAERTRWHEKIKADQEAQREREAKASATLIQQRQRDQVAADQRTKEIDNATRHIPDQTPTARQRVRVCLELRRQGKAPPNCRGVGTR